MILFKSVGRGKGWFLLDNILKFLNAVTHAFKGSGGAIKVAKL